MAASTIGLGRLVHERSHTDPGHVSRIPSRSPHVRAIPRIPPPVSTFSTPGRELQGRPIDRGYAAVSNSSGSELDLRGDRGRALFVTNAVIVPSSSSSSEEVETSQLVSYVPINSPTWSSHMPQRNHPFGGRSAQSGVGLGLGTPETMGNTHPHVAPHMASGGPDAGIENEYNFDPGDEDADPLAVSSSASSARLRSLVLNRQISHPSNLNRNGSGTSGGMLPNPWDSGDARPSEGDQRRRELIELVNELDNGSLGSAQTYEYDDLSDDEYSGEQGLAISPSDYFENVMDTTLKPGDETYLRHRSPGTSHVTPRPTSTAPTTVASPSEHNEYSPPSNICGTLAKDQTIEAHKRDQEAKYSPLSEYSGDEDVVHVSNEATPASSQRISRGTLAKGHFPFRSTGEGERPLSSRVSPAGAPISGIGLPTSMRLRTSGSGRSPEITLRTSREMPATSSLESNFDQARGSGAGRGLNRIRKRKPTQCSLARVQDTSIPHADSSSSIESLRWQHEGQDISIEAEAVFEQLGTGRQSVASPLPQWQGNARRFPTNRSPPKSSLPGETPNSRPESTTDLPNSHDDHRDYVGPNVIQLPQREQPIPQASDPEQRTWLSTISSSAYHSLLDRYGDVEIKRQQIIWDLCEAERVFVRRLQTFVRLFICPLRMKDSVTWLAGVPTEVARLFDWLEDIINLHAQISSALRAIVSEQYPIVMRIAGRVRSFVSRLEVYQPYVVRLESTTLLIKRLSGESSNDFGEFIRIQQEQDECHGWSVEAFLVEPVNRLVDYPIHFKVRTTCLTSPSVSKIPLHRLAAFGCHASGPPRLPSHIFAPPLHRNHHSRNAGSEAPGRRVRTSKGSTGTYQRPARILATGSPIAEATS